MCNIYGRPKVLFVSNTLSHIISFHLPYLKWFKDRGFEVHVMTNTLGKYTDICCDKLYDIGMVRSPFNPINLLALFRAKKIIKRENYEIIHCHTPMGGVIGRLASNGAKKSRSKIFYTAHGFHFYTGAPIINWIIYYNIEKFLSHYTDCIITINNEDFERAKKRFQTNRTTIRYISGIGVDSLKFKPTDIETKNKIKSLLGYEGKFVLFYAAEFIERKNHVFLIECIVKLNKLIPNIKMVFAGNGKLYNLMMEKARKLCISQSIDFLGFRTDVPQLLQMCDALVSSSKQEGFPINLVEGMMSGVPIIASKIRGHNDIIAKNGTDGYLFDLNDQEEFCSYVYELYTSSDKYNTIIKNSLIKSGQYDLNNSIRQMNAIYNEYL